MKSVAKPLFLAIVLWNSSASALHLDANLFYFSDSFANSSNSTVSYSFYEGSLNMDLNKKGGITLGWSYLMTDNQQKTTSTYKYSSSDMGPRLNFFFDKEKKWNIGVTYNLIASAKYEAPSVTDTVWKGTSLKADLGYGTDFGSAFFIGFKLNYYSASWAEQLVNDTTYSKIAYTRAWIFPSIQFRWHLDGGSSN